MCIQLCRLINFCLCILVMAYASVVAAGDSVGQVMLATGEATRQAGNGQPEPLRDGAQVYAGDTLQTGKGSVLQLKMVDNALLILQADSRVLIEAYTFNKAEPSSQVAKITLHKGRVRSVTGQLGESNHDAFRLNTPIAAIGIRGTDFETSTNEDVTRVRLNSGAIVLSAFNDSCLPEGVGPCMSDKSLLLTDDLESPVAELRSTDSAPRLIQLQDYQSDDQTGTDDETTEKDAIVSQQQAGNIVGRVDAGKGGASPGDRLPDGWQDKIHWGRWDRIQLQDTPSVSELVEDDKEILFANDVFVLFRDPGFSVLGNDKASFYLLDSQAVIAGDGNYSPVNISGGSLSIDFGERQFDTSLSVNSSYTGSLALNASGTVDSLGMFRSDTGNMEVYGGLSAAGEQAGYLFNHALSENLSIQGATQWQRP